jgi:hypothetical protein
MAKEEAERRIGVQGPLTLLYELGGLDAERRGKLSDRAALRFSLVPFNAEHRSRTDTREPG